MSKIYNFIRFIENDAIHLHAGLLHLRFAQEEHG